MDTAAHSPFALLPLRGSRRTGDASPAGMVDLPSAVPAWGGGEGVQTHSAPIPAAVLDRLRASIAKLERPSLQGPGNKAKYTSKAVAWALDCKELDEILPQGLEAASLHELKPSISTARTVITAQWTASLGFGLRLAALRLRQTAQEGRPASMLWCWPRVLANEVGRPCARGLSQLGIDPARLIFVETAREADALFALEEGLKSRRLALAFGVLEAAALNPARRLSLAAGAGNTPCLIATHPASEGAAGCATRWLIRRAGSSPHPFDAKAPGLARFVAKLDRCRARPQSTGLPPLVLEWCDETLRFRVAAQLASDMASAHRARQGS